MTCDYIRLRFEEGGGDEKSTDVEPYVNFRPFVKVVHLNSKYSQDIVSRICNGPIFNHLQYRLVALINTLKLNILCC
jgi:hypothetical protein